MPANSLLILGVLLSLLVVVGIARYFSTTTKLRNTLSVILVALGLVTAFFLFFSAGALVREHRLQPPAATTAP